MTAPWIAPRNPTPARWIRTSRHRPSPSSQSPRRDSSRESMKDLASSAMAGSDASTSDGGRPATSLRRPPRSKAAARKPGGSPSGSMTHRVRSVRWASAGETAATTAPVSGGRSSREPRWSNPV
ncbi:hypothetical protein [Planotetraspora silvatica]|uniref:hypothetical protein n=1 Tax=Planotetraspora silvatica TaxID=234614 RepID=UPI001EF28765|nr:hypothetical protein [Planotetraspora silvatica]